MTHTVGIFIYNDVEVLDFAGPFEVFCTASRLHARQYPDQPPLFDAFTIAETRGIVLARGGLSIQPRHTIADHPLLDVLIIPGGIHTPQMQHKAVIDWIASIAKQVSLTASVCTGAFLLAQAGLLDGLPATTHREDIHDLRTAFPLVSVIEDKRWVEAGSVITSAGISAGIDMSLYIIERLEGSELALLTACQMEWRWDQPENTAR